MRISLTAAAVFLALYAAPALADRDPQSGAPLPPKKHEASSPITDHFFVRASFYGPQMRTNLRIDPANPQPGVTGTAFNAESELGLPDKLRKGRVEFMFRLRDRNKVRVDYFEADRSGNKVLSEDIAFNNVTFLAGQAAQSSFDWKQFDITYTYSFVRNDRFEVGSGLAVYFLQVDAIMTQQPPFALQLHQEVSAATPFPALPLDATWRISNRWAATARRIPQGEHQRLSRLVRGPPRGPAVSLEPELRHRGRLFLDPRRPHTPRRLLPRGGQPQHQRTGSVRAFQLLAAKAHSGARRA